MRRDDQIVGLITATRSEVGKFADKEVDLLQTFARQAVIAIENVRLFNETTEALEQQKAAAEILSVISSSVADTKPVFDKILESCKHLFGSDETAVLLVDEEDQVQPRRLRRQRVRSRGRDFSGADWQSRRPAAPSTSGASCTTPMWPTIRKVTRAVRRVAQLRRVPIDGLRTDDVGTSVASARSACRAREAPLPPRNWQCCRPLPIRR